MPPDRAWSALRPLPPGAGSAGAGGAAASAARARPFRPSFGCGRGWSSRRCSSRSAR